MQRHHDWQQRLTEYLVATAATPFRPGQHDCALWAAGAIEAMTGENPALRFDYTRLHDGLKVLKSRGYDDHISYVDAHFAPVHPAFVQPGDLVAVDGDLDQSLGIVLGETVAVLRRRGWGHVPLTAAVQGWRV